MFIISILLVPTFSIDSVFDLIRYTFGQTQRSSSCTCPIIISFFQNALGTRGTSRGGACANYPYSIKQNIAVHTGREESVSRVDSYSWYPHLQVPPDTFQVLYSCLSFLFLEHYFSGASILLILILFLLLLVLSMFTLKAGIHPFHLIIFSFIHFIFPSMPVFTIGI